MAATTFVISVKELKTTQIAQINQLFRLLNLIRAYGDAFYGLIRMHMSKNLKNDVSKDSPIYTI